MKFTTQIATSASSQSAPPATRSQARAFGRYNRAMVRFARTEVAVESALRRVHAAEAALIELIENVDLAEAPVLDLLIPRDLAPDVLGMAQHDLRVAVRRRADAASQVSHRYLAVASLARV